MKNKLALLGFLAFTFGTLCSCGPANAGDKESTLTMWAGGQWVQHDAENLKSFIQDYNSKHDIKINLTIKSEFETSLASAILVGKQPDLVIWDRFNTPTYAGEDYLTTIDDFIERDQIDTTMFQEQAYGELSYKGHQYGLPLDLDIWGVYVNMDLIDKAENKNALKARLTENWTWDDLKDVAKAVAKKTSSGFNPAGYSADDLHEHFFKFIASTGSDFGANGEINYDTPEVRAVLNYFKNFGASDVCNSDYNGKDAFKNNRLVMLNQPVYFSSYLKKYAPNLNYKFLPQPRYTGGNGKNGGMIGGFGIALPNAIEKYQTDAWKERREKAWTFMKSWICDEEVALEWSKVSNTLPALKSLYSNEWIQNTEVLKAAASYASQYETRPSVPGFLNIQINVYNKYVKEWYKGAYDGSIEDLLKDLKEGTDLITSRYVKKNGQN